MPSGDTTQEHLALPLALRSARRGRDARRSPPARAGAAALRSRAAVAARRCAQRGDPGLHPLARGRADEPARLARAACGRCARCVCSSRARSRVRCRRRSRCAAGATASWRGAAASGLLWGAAGLFLFPEHSLPHQVFVSFVVAGMIAGAVGTLSPRDLRVRAVRGARTVARSCCSSCCMRGELGFLDELHGGAVRPGDGRGRAPRQR